MIDTNKGSTQSRGYVHAYHEQITNTILARARVYVHRPRRTIAGAVIQKPEAARTEGDAIRARIAANAQKRFEIAEAMKREAGVRDHRLTGQHDGGIAWTDRASILAPEGENRVQLATLAHECGHVFLHAAGTPGHFLPGHVKEMEAESFAHQAFRAHDMRMPAKVTAWGRAYVGRWVVEDRAACIQIDPRAEAYAKGTRSPYEPLRIVPDTWTGVAAEAVPLEWRDRGRNFNWRLGCVMRGAGAEFKELLEFVYAQTCVGVCVTYVALALMTLFGPAIPLQKEPGTFSISELMLICDCGLLWAAAALMWKTASADGRRGRVHRFAKLNSKRKRAEFDVLLDWLIALMIDADFSEFKIGETDENGDTPIVGTERKAGAG